MLGFNKITLIAVVAAVFVALVSANVYLWPLHDSDTEQIFTLKKSLERAEVAKKASEKALSEHMATMDAILTSRIESDKDVAEANNYTGTDRIDYLLRVLEDDYSRRCVWSSGGTSSAVSGTTKH